MSEGQDHSSKAPFGGAGSSTCSTQPLPPTRQAPHPPTARLRLHRAAALLGTLTQAAVVAAQWRSEHSLAGKAYTVAVLVPTAALAASTWLAPALFWRHRSLLWSAARVVLYSIPSFRKAGVGLALMLERPPLGVWKGVALDAARAVCGTRLVGLLVGGVAIPLPPGVALATQAALLALTANSPDYCATRLLAAPLMQRRMARLAAALDAGAAPALVLLYLAEPAAAVAITGVRWDLAPQAACLAVLPFLQFALGVLLPAALSAFCWQSDDAPPKPAAAMAPPVGGSHASPTAEAVQPGGCRPRATEAAQWARNAVTLAQNASGAADRLLRAAFGPRAGHWARAAVSWWLLALCWALCRSLPGVQLAADGAQEAC